MLRSVKINNNESVNGEDATKRKQMYTFTFNSDHYKKHIFLHLHCFQKERNMPFLRKVKLCGLCGSVRITLHRFKIDFMGKRYQ